MRVALFDFPLPNSAIALNPARPRSAARMLVVMPDGQLLDSHVKKLPDFLTAKDRIVVNNSRVIPANMRGYRQGIGQNRRFFSFLLYKKAENQPQDWHALVRPARKIHCGDQINFTLAKTPCPKQQAAKTDFLPPLLSAPLLSAPLLSAIVREKKPRGEIILSFALPHKEIAQKLADYADLALPPYILQKRPLQAEDYTDYQTIYARHDGSIAAPTAGLHFDQTLNTKLAQAKIMRSEVTLHVGPGTFQPVNVGDTTQHKIPGEWGALCPKTARQLNHTRKQGKILAVGTTCLRILETACHASGDFTPFQGQTSLFITPGYHFKSADLLLTNFHLPRSTLFMLVAAFCGLERIHHAYQHAIAKGYRFYSYGDACLLFRPNALV